MNNTVMLGLIIAVVAMVVGQVTSWIEDWLAKRRRDTRRAALVGLVIQSILGAAAFFFVVRGYLGY